MRTLVVLALLGPCAAPSPEPMPVASAVPEWQGPARVELGNEHVRVTLRLDRFGLAVADAGGRVLLDTVDALPARREAAQGAYGPLGATEHATVIRPPAVEGWDHVRGSDAPWRQAVRVVAETHTATGAALDLVDPGDPAAGFHLDVTLDGPEVRVDARVTSPGGALNRVGQAFALPADEHFFGLGERSVTVDHRGRHYENWVEEGGIGGGERARPGPTNPFPNGPGMTHVPVPFVLSTRGYGLWLDTTHRSGFALGAEAGDAWRLYAADDELHYRVLVHRDPRATLAHFTRLTGRARLPAPWVFGPRRRVDHGVLVRGVPEARALRDARVPTTMVDDTTHFLPNGGHVGREAALAAWNREMHALGYKTIAYFNPHVAVEHEPTRALAEHGLARGFFVRDDAGRPFETAVVSSGARRVLTIDYTNPDAVAWYQSLLQGALDLGYDGWMLDFGEYLPQRARLHDGRTGWEMHNAFPVLFQRVTYEHLRRARGDDFLFFARAGFTGTQAVTPVVWGGDPSASFDDAKGLPAAVRQGVNLGLSGVPFYGSDVGGYTCLNDPPADKEVYLRWAEFGALSPDMHDENACAGAPAGAPPKWTLWSDAETTEVYARYARLHTRLFPYLYAAAREAQETGLPVMRHPVLHHPEERAAWDVSLEYWFGPALYVAPVVRRGERARSHWLPPGGWFDWWTLAPVAGGATVTRDAPLDVLPLYLRAGAVVALLDPAVETLAPDAREDVVSMADAAGVYDVRAAADADAPRGAADLVDGTHLEVALGEGAVALPEGWTEATEASLATCARCGRIDPLPGGARRVRLSTARAQAADARAGALAVRHAATDATRVRWDVVVVPR